MELLNSFRQKFIEIIKGDKKIKIFTLLGLIGILLIFLSTTNSFDKKKDKEPLNNSSYLQTLESRVLKLVKGIDGVGKVNVMVTLEGGVEYVFAQEQKNSADKTEDYDGNNIKKIQQSDDSEEKYILVDGNSGKREALVKTELEPKVKGVVIVCQGADDPIVQNRILEAVTTVLDISSTRVCVTKSN